ncbi:hypothetical protein LEM8419_01669 [Neolewinella maritima]|uniref:Histidine phosphatase family protein n=1 Tax=Neolewinella maritima TaxID=1383882 RepID=A0ABN8F1C5_9BACT|nr:phosphoglycerate mutase family protein [Neolewinella maritima]CAH1000516.1 hypothetical protein LEM8419_01669 [Neolewinella maritima]
MIQYLILSLLLLTTASCDPAGSSSDASAEAAAATTTVILVRHAEKAAGEDPELTAAGTERAKRLQLMLSEADLAAVYSTDTRRTQATAGPTAQDHGLDIQTYDASGLPALAKNLVRSHAGRTVLVVGHSNTTPDLLTELVGPGATVTIDAEDFGTIYVVSARRSGRGEFLHLRY